MKTKSGSRERCVREYTLYNNCGHDGGSEGGGGSYGCSESSYRC